MIKELTVALVTLQLHGASVQDAVESGFNPSASEWNEIQVSKSEVISKLMEEKELF